MAAAFPTDEDGDSDSLELSTRPSPPSFKFHQNSSSAQNLLSRAGSGYESQYGSLFGSRVSLSDGFRLNVEVNNIREWVMPSICEDYMLKYVNGEQYLKDMEVSINSVRAYLRGLRMEHEQKYAVVLDVDETAISSDLCHNFSYDAVWDATENEWRSRTFAAVLPVLALYHDLSEANFSIFFISERPERLFDLTAKSLLEAGYEKWTSLILRSADDGEGTVSAYKTKKRREIEMQGYRIVGVLGDQWSDIDEPMQRTREFKLPNPMYRII